MENVIEVFENDLNNIPVEYQKSAGSARYSSGILYENLIKNILENCNLIGKKNDYKRTEEVNGQCLKNLQVDWHVYKNNKMIKAIESKTYLDACYLKRAVMDFIELEHSPEVPDDVEYCIFAGQNACGKDAFAYYPAFFKKITGKDLKIFFMHDSKRKSNKGIYKQENRHLFELNKNSLNEFVQWLNG